MFKKVNNTFIVRRKISIRRVSQFFNIFLFFFFTYKLGVYPLHEKLPLNIYFKIDGLLAFALTIMNPGLFQYFIPGFLMILLIFLIGNFFCFWVCPVGGCIDYLNIIFRRKFWKVSLFSINLMKLRMIGFWILACVVISALFNSLFGFVFLGFVFDPFIILGQAVSSAGFWLILLFLILILSTLYPRLWCNSFCPLGRFYSIIGILLGKIKNSR